MKPILLLALEILLRGYSVEVKPFYTSFQLYIKRYTRTRFTIAFIPRPFAVQINGAPPPVAQETFFLSSWKHSSNLLDSTISTRGCSRRPSAWLW